jgi:tetratricopeptide (TPR) repeat protein
MIESKSVTNPFPGLRPFKTNEYRLFFGREGQSEALITRLQRSRFLAVVGTSGSGKSSLVRAGLLPALRGGMMAGAGSGWRISIMRPGNDPFGNLAQSLAQKDVLPEAGGRLSPAEAEAAIEAQLRSGSLGLVDTAKGARLTEPEKLLVLVDQFEELFRFRAARAAANAGDEASAFVKLLLEAAQQREVSIYVVLTMRSDFLGDCAQFQGLPEAINDGQYLIPRMTRDERRIAIAGPVGVTRGKMAEPLINRLLNDVGDNPDQLPILQHALMRTWDYWAAHRRNGEPIGLEHYEAIGAMSEALSLHADEAWEELPDQHSEMVAEKLFKALTEKGADNREIRRPTRLSEIAAGAEVTEAEVVAVIERFRREGRSFLMPPVGFPLNSDTVIDISHESLIRNWDRLQVWVDEEAESAGIYRRLAENAVLHREGKEGLLQDPALQIGLDWRKKSRPNAAWAGRYHPEFAEAMSFLDQSKQAREADLAAQEKQRQEQLARERRELKMAQDFAEKQARTVRRMRWLTAGMAVMFLVALVIAVWAWRQRTNAEAFAKAAQQSEANALAEKKRAQKLADDLGTSSDELVKNNKKLAQERVAKEEAAKLAEKRATEALAATKIAESEKARAEKKTVEAEAAKARAVESADEAQAAVERGELIKEGLEAARRQDMQRAYHAFDNLARMLDAALRPAGRTLSKEELANFNTQLGWALTNFGSVERQIGNIDEAQSSYERARDQLEKVWPKPSHLTHLPDGILFETYHGLGNTYRDLALMGYLDKQRAQTKSGASEYFEKAREVYQYALGFQQGRLQRSWDDVDAADEVAAGHLNLARLYRDMGMPEKAEESLIALADLREQHGSSKDLVAARRELAEFYRNQNRYEDAEQAYIKLIDTQENISDVEADYARQGQDIADSYNELVDVYRALDNIEITRLPVDKAELDRKERAGGVASVEIEKERTAILGRESRIGSKAEGASGAAMAIQRMSMKFRQFRSGSPEPEGKTERDDLADTAATLYARLGKLDLAVALYEYAKDIREKSTGADHKDLWISYDNLRKLYLLYKDRTKMEVARHRALAEKYNKLLLDAVKDMPQKTRYANALLQLGALYALDDNRYPESEVYYNQALLIFQGRRDWMNENIVWFRLGKLYEKEGKETQREQALKQRVDTLARYFSQITSPPGPRPENPVSLVSEYLYAINSLAAYYKDLKTDVATANAEAVYHQAFLAANAITSKIYSEGVLKFYAATLDDYQKILKANKQVEVANQVGEVANTLREKLRQDDERRRQNAQLKQSAPAESTSSSAP